MTAAAPTMNAALDEFVSELASRLSPGAILRRSEPMSRRTTLRVGGPADVYAEPETDEDLRTLLIAARSFELPVMMLGRGSNLLVRDGGIPGLVICLSRPAFTQIEVDRLEIRCGAGARQKDIAHAARRAGIAGLEFLDGIPGTLGGALRMNAGAMGAWVFQFVQSIRFMTPEGDIHELPADEIQADYRCCPLLRTNFALGATLCGKPDDPAAIEARMSAYNEKRWASQPPSPSAGCIFKNPAAIPAGKLVDELGLKGARQGGAMVSDIHGNFIVNQQGATAREVLSLIELVRATALRERGIDLHTEVEIVGVERVEKGGSI